MTKPRGRQEEEKKWPTHEIMGDVISPAKKWPFTNHVGPTSWIFPGQAHSMISMVELGLHL